MSSITNAAPGETDEAHRRKCGELAAQGRLDEAVTECETALSLVPSSPHNKMALATALAESKRDLPRALTLAKEALPEVSGDPIALGMYCTVLLDARTMPGIDAQLDDCIKHLYVIDPLGMESNALGAMVATLRGNRELARTRLETAKKAGLPDAEYAQLAAQIDGRPTPAPRAAAKSHSTLAIVAGLIGLAALMILGVRLWRGRRR